MTQIQLSRGQFAIVDDDDVEWLSYFSWHVMPAVRPNGGFYAATSVGNRTVYLHRLIMRAETGQTVDHINSDKLDCRRTNLRIATRTEQARNSIAKGGRSAFKGVSLHESGRWRAEIELPGRKRIVKYAGTEVDAARLYDDLAREHFGIFAKLNGVAS